jgi:hypothetical protein
MVSSGGGDGMAELSSAMTALVSSASGMEGGMPELLEDSIVHCAAGSSWWIWA